MAKSPQATATEHDRWPAGIAHNRGFRLLGTPLGFYKNPRATLLFCSHPDSGVPRGQKRILLSTFSAAALDTEKRGLDALAMDFQRKIRLGKLDLELWPSGLGPGGAQLLTGLKGSKLLYCDGVRLGAPAFGPGAQVPKCDILLIDYRPSAPKPPSAKNILRQIHNWTKSIADGGKIPVLACEDFSCAAEVLWQLKEDGRALRTVRSLFEKARRCGSWGLNLGTLRRLEQDVDPGSVVVHRARLFEKSPLFGSDRIQVAYAGPAHLAPGWASQAFRLGEPEDRAGLAKYVALTGAKTVALGPQCDEATSILLQKKGFDVYRVRPPEQIPLPWPSTA